jgi:DNA primase catalytic subunit
MIGFKEYLSEKPLTPQQRIQRGRIMKRLAPKIAMKRKIAMKKKATPEKLKVRAMKQARDVVRAKFVKGKSYDELSYSEKIQLDKKVEKKQALIKKIAKKLLPKIKKAEVERIKQVAQQAQAQT